MKAEEEIKLSLSGAKEAFEASLRNIAQMQQGLEEEFMNMEEFERAARISTFVRLVQKLKNGTNQ